MDFDIYLSFQKLTSYQRDEKFNIWEKIALNFLGENKSDA